MKIERVNENQIRCTLTREDLADRELKISELAYGTEKAKTLFRDMMQQASFECGFEADDIPLMIEAIPLSDCIVLLITKVEDPEELDTRFSRFAPSVHGNGEEPEGEIPESFSGADDILDMFRKIQSDHINNSTDESGTPADGKAGTQASVGSSLLDDIMALKSKKKKEQVPNVSLTPVSITKIYSFSGLNDIINLSHILNGYYSGSNDLYKESKPSGYYLLVDQGSHTPEEYNKICNICSEYGREKGYTPASMSFLKEHCSPVITGNAIQSLEQVY